MKYIVCKKPGLFQAEQKEFQGHYGITDVALEIKTVGICGTDFHAFAGNQAFFSYPRILGHELGAKVVAAGAEVNQVRVGDRVLVMPYIHCGQCRACNTGKTNCCSSLQVLGVHMDGGMQERIILPAHLLIPVSGLGYDALAIVEPLSIGAHALRRADVQKGQIVIVVGCGPIGLGICKQAKLLGATVIACDLDMNRLNYAHHEMGVDFVVKANEDPLSRIAELTSGELAHVVFDATGNKLALEQGHRFMGHGGTYVLVGIYNGDLNLHHPSIHAKETSVLCSRNATKEDFLRVIEILKNGNFPVESFITHRATFDHFITEFDAWTKPGTGVIKAMIEV